MQRKSGTSEDLFQLKGRFSLWVACLGVQALGLCKAPRERFDCSSFKINNEINWEKKRSKNNLMRPNLKKYREYMPYQLARHWSDLLAITRDSSIRSPPDRLSFAQLSGRFSTVIRRTAITFLCYLLPYLCTASTSIADKLWFARMLRRANKRKATC